MADLPKLTKSISMARIYFKNFFLKAEIWLPYFQNFKTLFNFHPQKEGSFFFFFPQNKLFFLFMIITSSVGSNSRFDRKNFQDSKFDRIIKNRIDFRIKFESFDNLIFFKYLRFYTKKRGFFITKKHT